jgi:hypothetical protein
MVGLKVYIEWVKVGKYEGYRGILDEKVWPMHVLHIIEEECNGKI